MIQKRRSHWSSSLNLYDHTETGPRCVHWEQAKEREDEHTLLQRRATSAVTCACTATSVFQSHQQTSASQAAAKPLGSPARCQSSFVAQSLQGLHKTLCLANRFLWTLCALQETTAVILLPTTRAQLPFGSASTWQRWGFTTSAQIYCSNSPSLVLCSALFFTHAYGKAAARRLSVLVSGE